MKMKEGDYVHIMYICRKNLREGREGNLEEGREET
jgi:hypothetical protein